MGQSRFRIMLAASAAFFVTTGPLGAASLADDPKVAAKLKAAQLWLEATLEHEAVPAASVAIVHDQEVIWADGFGVASLDAGAPATADTRYSVCSISKLFTSIGAMQLRDAGALNLDAPVGAYLDWFEIGDIDGAEEPVTLRNILSHVSGLPRETDIPYWTEVDFPDIETIRTTVTTQEKLYRPYDYFQYSNLGMTLVGETVAAVSGRGFDDYMREEILEPLGMAQTTTDHPLALRGGDFAVGYKARNGAGERGPFEGYTMKGVAAAAGFVSSVNDLSKFARWQFRLRENGGEEILKATTLREMQRVHWIAPDFDGVAWGLGFATRRHQGKTFWGHGGYCPGYRSEFLTRPEDKLAFITMVNVNDVNPREIAFALYDLVAADIKAAAEARDNKDGKKDRKKKSKRDYSVYEGVYLIEGYDWHTYFGFDGKTLFSIDLYTDNPAGSLSEYAPVEGEDHLFRRKREDGSLAETVRFEVDKDGRAARVWRHSIYLTRQDYRAGR